MSASGVGRGRGWLKLDKNNASAPRPGVEMTLPQEIVQTPRIKSQDNYVELIKQFNHLNTKDDGIMLNQKIRYIMDYWSNACEDGDDVKKSFQALHRACLKDEELATKCVLLFASKKFYNQKHTIHDVGIRSLFLHQLQDNFENRELLKSTNLTMFHNSLRIFNEFFEKATLSDGQKYNFLHTPLLSYIEMLLEAAQPTDIRSLINLLSVNGEVLVSDANYCQRLNGITNEIKLLLTSDKPLTRNCKLLLLLCLDLINIKFRELPLDVYNFYKEQLGDEELEGVCRPPSCMNHLEIKIPESKREWSTDTSILQKSNTCQSIQIESSNGSLLSSFSQLPQSDTSEVTNSSGFSSDSTSQYLPTKTKPPEKVGRPILGVGARLNKNKSTDYSSATKMKPFSIGETNKKNSTKRCQGWQHDDRFDND